MATFDQARRQERIGAPASVPTVPATVDPDTWISTDIAKGEFYFSLHSGKYRCWTRDDSGIREIIFSDDIQTLIESLIDAAVDALKGGVPSPGDTLNKLYNMILGAAGEVTVANIAARDAYNVVLPLNIFVLDDGDTRWALYKATTAGVGATFVKISDPDLLNAVVSAATILATILTGLDTGSATVVTAADNILSAIGKLQAQISAEQAARQAAISAVNIAILAGDQANGAAIASEETDRIAADAALQTQINQLPKFQKVPFTLIDNRHIELNNAVTNIMISKNGITLDDQAPASDFTYNDIVEVEFNEELMDDDIIVVRGNYYLAP